MILTFRPHRAQRWPAYEDTAGGSTGTGVTAHAGAAAHCATREKLKLWLGAAESFVDDFFWSRWRFEISVFDLFSVGRG